MSVPPAIINPLKKKGANMSTMINEICSGCEKVMGQVSIYDAEFISNSTCWDCADEALYKTEEHLGRYC